MPKGRFPGRNAKRKTLTTTSASRNRWEFPALRPWSPRTGGFMSGIWRPNRLWISFRAPVIQKPNCAGNFLCGNSAFPFARALSRVPGRSLFSAFQVRAGGSVSPFGLLETVIGFVKGEPVSEILPPPSDGGSRAFSEFHAHAGNMLPARFGLARQNKTCSSAWLRVSAPSRVSMP